MGQAAASRKASEAKMVVLGDPERSVLQYVSTGSAQNRHLQPGMGRISTHPSRLMTLLKLAST